MKFITELQGIGINKKCIIIGGGMSVKEFEFNKLPDDFIRISVNNSSADLTARIDYSIYSDIPAVRVMEKLNNLGKVIGLYNSRKAGFTDYTFTYNQIMRGGTIVNDNDNAGYKALVIAKIIMKFDKIFLVGFDFTTAIIDGVKVSHHYGDTVGPNEKYFDDIQLKHHFGRLKNMIIEFNRLTDKSNIYNCNRDSLLKLFPVAMPY